MVIFTFLVQILEIYKNSTQIKPFYRNIYNWSSPIIIHDGVKPVSYG